MSWAHLRTTTPVAAKPHQCFWCRGRIERGTRHVAETAVYDGQAYTLRYHSECRGAFSRWIELVDPDRYEDAYDPWESDDRPIRGSWLGELRDPGEERVGS